MGRVTRVGVVRGVDMATPAAAQGGMAFAQVAGDGIIAGYFLGVRCSVLASAEQGTTKTRPDAAGSYLNHLLLLMPKTLTRPMYAPSWG